MSSRKNEFKKRFGFSPIDEEEMELINEIESSEAYQSIEDGSNFFNEAVEAAKNYFSPQKTKSISMRMDLDDYWQIRKIAQSNGLPYQTLIKSVIHKYITNQERL